MGRWEPAAGMPYWTCQTNLLRPCFLSWLFSLYTNTRTNSSTSLFVPKGSLALSSRGQLAFWKSTFFHLLLSSQSQETNPPAAVKARRHNMPTTTLRSLRVPSRGEHLRSARLSLTFLKNKQTNKTKSNTKFASRASLTEATPEVKGRGNLANGRSELWNHR